MVFLVAEDDIDNQGNDLPQRDMLIVRRRDLHDVLQTLTEGVALASLVPEQEAAIDANRASLRVGGELASLALRLPFRTIQQCPHYIVDDRILSLLGSMAEVEELEREMVIWVLLSVLVEHQR